MDNGEALERFDAYLRRRYPDRRTPVDYVSDVRQFQQACPKPWHAVSVDDMDAFVDQMRQAHLKPATIKRRVTALKVYFDFLAEETGQGDRSSPVRLRRHAGKLGRRVPRSLSDTEVAALLAVLDGERDRALVALMLRAGLRVSEVVGLTLEDIWLGVAPGVPARLRVLGKGQKERIVWLSPEATAMLTTWLAVRPSSDTTALFLNGRQQPLTVAGVQWLLKSYGRKIHVTLTPHRLRHTFARQLIEVGMPVESLARLMGHAQISTTQVYLEGADLALRDSFLQAMQRAEVGQAATDGDSNLSAQPDEPLSPDQGPVGAEPEYPPLPDTQGWATDLPEPIRQACLQYVHRHWLGWRPSQRRERALHVLGDFARFWRWVLSRRGFESPAELTAADLRAYMDERIASGHNPCTIKDALGRVFGLLHELAERGEPVSPTLFRVERPRLPDPLPRALSEAEYQRLEAQGRRLLEQDTPEATRDAAWFFVLAHTGLRLCELLDLRRHDVDLRGRRLHVQGKGSRERVVYLTPTAVQALQRYLRACPHPEQALLFVNARGRPLDGAWLRHQLRALAAAAGVHGVTPCRLRHTLATRLINVGAPITTLQKLLGHDYLSTTQIYARVYDATVERDYRDAMSRLERSSLTQVEADAMPVEWPVPKTTDAFASLDNSV
jgi:site-specific recombinase XerD